MKFFAPLSIKECLLLVALIITGFGWLLIDDWFLTGILLRFIALIVLLLTLFLALMLISKPEKVFQFVNSITLVSFTFIALISLILHILINKNFNFKSVLVWLTAAVIPYLAGFIYSRIKK